VSSMYADGTYLARNPTWHSEDAQWKAGQVVRLLQDLRLTPRSVADVGCGTGGVLVHLAAVFDPSTRFVGFDVSDDARRAARHGSPANVSFQDMAELDHDPGAYDLVMAIDVLEHVEDYLGFARRIAKLGTDKLFHIPLELSAQTVVRRRPIAASRECFGHLHFFTRDTALASIEAAGMTVIADRFTFSSTEQPAERMRRRLARVPRRVGFRLHADLAVRVMGGASLLVLAR
jgi:cyclopropane fatty-acyl-phospholipid synthase-like methyltransferase